MSLINQALHKAQRDRAPNRMPTGGTDADMPASYQTFSRRGPGLVIGLALGVIVLTGLVAGLTVVLLQKEPAPVSGQPETISTTATVQTTPAVPTAPPAPILPEPAPPSPTPTIPAATPPAETAPTASAAPSLLAELQAARQATEAKAVEAAAKAAAPLSDGILEWLNTAKVSGARFSEKGNKAIINSKAYTAGDYINYGLGLKVLTIEKSLITLGDENGKQYKLRY